MKPSSLDAKMWIANMMDYILSLWAYVRASQLVVEDAESPSQSHSCPLRASLLENIDDDDDIKS